VLIGAADDAVVFDWEPTLIGGAELLGGPRGTDPRLAEAARATRTEKRTSYEERYAARALAYGELDEERRAGHWTGGDDLPADAKAASDLDEG